MNAPLYSEYWYRIKDLRVQLAADIDVSRHVYRGRACQVLRRPGTRGVWRLDEAVWRLIARLDGDATLGDIWESALLELGDHAPDQNTFTTLISQLHEAEMLVVDHRLNAERLFARGDEARQRDLKQRFMNPLFMRFSLIDPDRFLARFTTLWSALFGRSGFVSWLILLLGTAWVIAPQMDRLVHETRQVDWLAPTNLLLIAVIYPLLKLVHELSHGACVKRFGGEVHELGIALMVLMPLPYVDASVTSGWPQKHRRIAVAAAGILAETTIAALAALLWSSTAPGSVHDIALLTLLIGGISTVLFNGNPLLRFDGYYMLADAIEIPNLFDRGKQFWLNTFKSRLLGMPVEPEALDHRERMWLAAHGALSAGFRLFLSIGIAVWLLGEYFFFGVLLALWVAATTLVLPMWKLIRFMISSTDLKPARAAWVTAGVFASLIVLLGVPLPNAIVADGVVWLPDNAIIRAGTDCEVAASRGGQRFPVEANDFLFNCISPELSTELAVVEASLDELDAELAGTPFHDSAARELVLARRQPIVKQLQSLTTRLGTLTLHAPVSGEFVVEGDKTLDGQHLQHGDIAGYVLPRAARTVRTAIAETEGPTLAAALTTPEPEVSLRFMGPDGESFVRSTRIVRHNPTAQPRVASPALTDSGGGEYLQDRSSDNPTNIMSPVFDVELTWPEDAPMLPVGQRLTVRIEGKSTSLGERLLRNLQRTFLERLNV